MDLRVLTDYSMSFASFSKKLPHQESLLNAAAPETFFIEFSFHKHVLPASFIRSQ